MVGMTAFAAAPSACRPSSIAFTAPHLAGSSSSTVSGPAVAPQQRGGVRVLRASSDQQEEAERQGGRKGFYVRPSKALEKGGGFYVPGVDGSRLRLGLAGAAVLLLFVNRAITPGGADPEFSQLVSEATVVCTAAVLGAQSIVSAPKAPAAASESGAASGGDHAASGPFAEPSLSETAQDRLEWLVQAAAGASPRGSCATVLTSEGLMASSSQPSAGRDAAQAAFTAAAGLFPGGQGGVRVVRRGDGEGGGVFGVVPASSEIVAVTPSAGGERMLVVSLPAGVRSSAVDENLSLWLEQLACMPVV